MENHSPDSSEDEEMHLMSIGSRRDASAKETTEERRRKEEEVEKAEIYTNGVLWPHKDLLGYFLGYIRASCLLRSPEDPQAPQKILDVLIECIRRGMHRSTEEQALGDTIVSAMKRIMDENIEDPYRIRDTLLLLLNR